MLQVQLSNEGNVLVLSQMSILKTIFFTVL